MASQEENDRKKRQEEASKPKPEAPKKAGEISGSSTNQGGKEGAAKQEESKSVGAKTSWSASEDPYASSLRGRSFKQGTGELEAAKNIRMMGQKNLQKDTEYLQGAFGLKKDTWNPANTTKEIIQNLEKQTGIKAGEGTQGLGNYSESDLAKYLNNPQVKTFVEGLKSGTEQVKQIAPEGRAPRAGEPGYQTDFQQRVAQYKETTKGNRLDTSRATPAQTTAQRVDPLQPMGGQIMGGIPKMGGGVYGPGGYGAEKVMTNRPAKTQQELEQRMAKFEQAGAPGFGFSSSKTKQSIVDNRPIQQRPSGAYLPGGQFIANQPKAGTETDEQRIARREKELGIGRFASKPSYFDDKSRGRRII